MLQDDMALPFHLCTWLRLTLLIPLALQVLLTPSLGLSQLVASELGANSLSTRKYDPLLVLTDAAIQEELYGLRSCSDPSTGP